MAVRHPARSKPTPETLSVSGARQHNLKGISLEIPTGTFTVVTGVSGSGKSSLAFDTLYAEGQRRYVETFSPYARQFLDRMDKPHVDRVTGIPPSIAIDQTNPVRTSRSTVGTMTELNDHLKLLFARAAHLHCRSCGEPVRRDTPQSVFDQLLSEPEHAGCEALIVFPVDIPSSFEEKEILELLERQGYQRILERKDRRLEVIQDRLPLRPDRRARWIEALETAFRHGKGRLSIHFSSENGVPDATLRFSEGLHCAPCDLSYRDPLPNHFSFNSPLGACETCKGFGRVISVDYGLVIPDESRTREGGAIRPWQSGVSRECQTDLLKAAKREQIPIRIPWRDLTNAQREWVLKGDGRWEDGQWYGVKGFFDWLEKKSYKMHIRVLLSKYRAYQLCPTCGDARLKPDSLLWRLGPGVGLSLHELMLLPIDKTCEFFDRLTLPPPMDQATEQLLGEIRTRLDYLREVGLGYLTLDRQSRTLSGGEVQRINLTTALGTSLVNTLFVLDEPSIGLHSRDIGRLIRILRRLRDAGNTLLVVEHDPEVILAADRVLDIGPGPGERGGEIVYHGDRDGFLRCRNSLTADYLVGRRGMDGANETPHPAVLDGTPRLEILGAAEHNLKGIDVRIPLNRFVCLAGVSGSGKSTLAQNILYPALLRRFGKPTEAPGQHRELRGGETLRDVILVDQSPLGKTSRSNPASVVGAFGAIRELFAKTPLAESRDYTPGTFSFNSGKGRCPTCSGSGFERVEMQFLSDVYLRCPDCDGRRYRQETLEITLTGAGRREPASIADVLEMTVSEADIFFEGQSDIHRALEPLRAVGLDYLRLGQPVPTLSGGEAQRLKLAAHLAGTEETRGPSLFLFDEPTTGLHPQDIAVLLRALRRLLAAGHSLLVIEHNLDVLRAADWILDLGPEGGEGGGRLVAEGTPETLAAHPDSFTGAALRATGLASTPEKTTSTRPPTPDPAIRIHHAREHNLKNIDAVIPRDQFTVITGVSGSGKSTLAFDILFAEGQRRYLESLNAYARQFVQPAARADVDSVTGIPPTVAIEQRTSRGGRKSTVATVTEIYHFLRLLFVKLGTPHCPDCELPIEAQLEAAIVDRVFRQNRGQTVHVLAPAIVSRKGYYTELAARSAKRGIRRLRVDGKWIPTQPWPRLDRFHEHTIDIPVAKVRILPGNRSELAAAIGAALREGHDSCRILADGPGAEAAFYSTRRACPRCERSFPELDPRLFSYNSKHGWCPTCYGTGLKLKGFDAEQTGEEIWWNQWWEGDLIPCPACQGRRLRPEALAVRFRSLTIADMAGWTVDQATKEFQKLALKGREAEIGRDLIAETRTRLGFLRDVGLSYLTLDRAAPTLSGGESQRIRLAAQQGSNLRGVSYILDEPTIGLHPRDNRMLLDTLRGLKNKGNTIVVVEHDEDTIREADHLLDLGPGAGVDGG
ncbi:MAG: excinuclease ABC subunit UvrA, partial [Kiritimatiellia bacterium]|nr:excinuclease ABC subunit UvrA [Kiritimatiellia bacterium]